MEKTILSRLLRTHSFGFVPRFRSIFGRSNPEGLFSITRSIGNDATKVEESGQRKVKETLTGKLVVLGGNGFLGSNICREALNCGFSVSSLSRSGRPSITDSWAVSDRMIWLRGDLLSADSLKHALDGVSSVISCVGAFGSNDHMYKINGQANINAIRAAASQGIKRFVFLSAADFGFVNYILQGYYKGKRATESELINKFPREGVILRPGFIYGTRQVGSIKLPLGLIGAPLGKLLKHAKPLTKIPLLGPLLIPPVNVNLVAKVAVKAVTDPSFPPGITDVYKILQYGNSNDIA